MEHKTEVNKTNEQTRVVDGAQASVVYNQAQRLLELYGRSIGRKNEGDKGLGFNQIIDDELGNQLKVNVTRSKDNELMFFLERQKGATRIMIDQKNILGVINYTMEDGVLVMDSKMRVKGKPKAKDPKEILGEISVLLTKTEDARNAANKPHDLLRNKSWQRRALVIMQAIGGAIIPR